MVTAAALAPVDKSTQLFCSDLALALEDFFVFGCRRSDENQLAMLCAGLVMTEVALLGGGWRASCGVGLTVAFDGVFVAFGVLAAAIVAVVGAATGTGSMLVSAEWW